tara:strand:+ start:322 stop:858 length:537 start_codon:yes stop_codon:yes gene_type:complete
MKINMACGWRNFGPDWVHIDGGDYDHLDYHCITSLQMEDETADLIYASHVLEYFDREEALKVLGEWKRVLRPGATLRVAVPDFGALIGLYQNGTLALDNMLGPLYGKMPMGSQTIYHKTAYDYESLNKLLTECGFRDIKLYDWRKTEHAHFDDHSQAYIPHMDKDSGTLVSLNVECVK